jgi:hypothetical protein
VLELRHDGLYRVPDLVARLLADQITILVPVSAQDKAKEFRKLIRVIKLNLCRVAQVRFSGTNQHFN